MRRNVWAVLLLIVSGCSSHRSDDSRSAEYGRRTDDSAQQLALINAQAAERARVEQERSGYKVAIESLLQQDDNTARIASYADRAAVMKGLDMSSCPSEFRVAYMAHVQAWEFAGRVQAASAELESGGYAAGTLVAALFREALNDDGEAALGNYAAQQREVAGLKQQASEQIRATFQRVEQIAVGYGAALPQH